MQFAYTILYVPDVLAAVAFYEAAFGLQKRFVSHESDYAELLTGETTLAFASESLVGSVGVRFRPNKPCDEAPGMEVAFVVDDVPFACDQAVKAGAVLVQAPNQKPWGQTVAHVRDLNGILVELCTTVDHNENAPLAIN